MLPAKNNSPTAFAPEMTLASTNARQSDSDASSGTSTYPKPWMPDYAFDLGIATLQPRDFQSNSFYEPHLHLDAAASPGRAGLGIHYPESKLAFVPNDFPAEATDSLLSFSPRLEASYSSSGLTFGDPSSSLNDSLNSSWSLSMIFADIPPGSETDSRGSLEPPADCSTKDLGAMAEDFSLETLSAAVGLTIEEFANRIAEGAKYALERVADLEHDGSATSLPATGHDTFPALEGMSFPDLPGLDLTDPWFPPNGGVNPADVMPAPLLSTGASLDEIFNLLGNGTHLEEPVLEYPAFPDVSYPMASTPPPMAPFTLSRMLPAPSSPRIKDDGDQLSDYEPPAFLSPSSSEYSPSLGSGRQYQTRGTRSKKRKIQPLSDVLPPNPIPAPGPSTEPSLPTSLPPIDLGSPVFDAHRGIDIEELKSRAERYRLRNQGREYDKRWLLSYAGKLSSKGELLEEFRCYITGCQQVNKRRDHILIHVGAHLDQRPFKCVHCSARFLRKNECKRHELSHTGIRPFTCNLCPFPATTFVRQDLLRRHMKRTHQVDDEKENKASTSSRPKKKTRKC